MQPEAQTPAFLTLQQIFDKSVGGVLRQGAFSRDSSGKCRYRLEREGATPLACAAGQLIPDNVDVTSFEGRAADAANELSEEPRSRSLALALTAGGVNVADPDSRSLLRELQVDHDESGDMAEFAHRACATALRCGLSYEVTHA